MLNRDKKGIVLFIVIGIIMVVVVLSIVILRMIANQSRLTNHQVTRIQAQYAAKAGMVYALEMLRTGAWVYSVSPPVNTCPNPGGCVVVDPDFTSSILNRQFRVIFCPSGTICSLAANYCTPPAGYGFCINSSVDFTYTP